MSAPSDQPKALTLEDVVDPEGEAPPSLRNLRAPGFRRLAWSEFDDTVIGEIAAEKPDSAGIVGLEANQINRSVPTPKSSVPL